MTPEPPLFADLPDTVDPQHVRLVEAMLFASATPLDAETLAERLPTGADLGGALAALADLYRGRGVELVEVAGGWAFRTAADLAPLLVHHREAVRRLSRAATETLATIAYHQPVTRPEIEEIRGVALGRGTLDTLLEAGWIRPGRRRDTPGRPTTWITTDAFLAHFGLARIEDLPGVDDLRAAGLLDVRPSAHIVGYREDGALGEEGEG